MGFATAAIIGSSALGAVSSMSAGNAQAGAARDGAKAQVDAARIAAESQERIADRQIGLSREVYDDQTSRFAPFLDSGTNALAAYNFEMGLGNAPMVGGTPLSIERIAGQEAPEITRSRNASSGSVSGLFGGASGNLRMPSTEEIRNRPNQDEVWFSRQRQGGQNAYSVGDRTFSGRSAAEEFAAGLAQPEQFRVGDQTFSDRAEADRFASENATGGTEYQGIDLSSAARFAIEQGRDATEAGAAARGNLSSGATLAGLERLRFGMAAQDRENQLNRLGGMVDMGQGAAGMQASAGNAFAGQANNALGQLGAVQANTAMQAGQAQAAGFMNAANARGAGMMGASNALAGGVSNLLGWQAYQNAANAGAQGGMF